MSQRLADHDKKKESIERFDWFNKSRSGKLTPEELQSRLVELGHNVSVEEAQAMIKIADHDNDGMLSLTEFQDYESEVFNFKM
jgi:Ca2+-binding EF-hand superfamily protein